MVKGGFDILYKLVKLLLNLLALAIPGGTLLGPLGRCATLTPFCIRFVSGFHSWRSGLGWGGCAGSERD